MAALEKGPRRRHGRRDGGSESQTNLRVPKSDSEFDVGPFDVEIDIPSLPGADYPPVDKPAVSVTAPVSPAPPEGNSASPLGGGFVELTPPVVATAGQLPPSRRRKRSPAGSRPGTAERICPPGDQ